jgi:hypothetical protein
VALALTRASTEATTIAEVALEQRFRPLCCHCEALSDKAISRPASRRWFIGREIASSLRASQ